MCKICDDVKTGDLSIKQALDAIGAKLVKADKKEAKHLWDLSEKILSEEVPESVSNQELDEKWWKSTHKEEE